jgi:replication initiation and membrane attachment protein
MCSLKLRLEELIEARELLEGIGLIKTYYKEGSSLNQFVYELYSPMSAYEFLTNPILSTTLYNNIGAKEYERTIKYFKTSTIKKENYYIISLNEKNKYKLIKKLKRIKIYFYNINIINNSVFTI